MRSTGIQAIAYNRLKAHWGLTGGHTRVYDLVQQLAEPETEVLDKIGADVLDAGWDFPTEWRSWPLPDGSPGEVPEWFRPVREDGSWRAYNTEGVCIAEMPKSCVYFTQSCHPMAESLAIPTEGLAAAMDKVSWAAMPVPMFHDGLSDENLQRMREHTRRLHETTDRALMIGFGGNLFEWTTFLRRMDNVLMDLLDDRKGVETLLDALVEMHLANLDKVIDAVGEYVDIIQMGDDLGSEGGPMFSPQLYREVFKPRHRTLFEHIKKRSKMKVFLHSCGSISRLLPDLIETGIDIINPVQINAADMDPSELKRTFGNDVTFWGGGCDTQSILPRAKPQEVHDHVRRLVDIWAPGGGFVFTPVHNILSEVPPVNVEAVYRALDRL